MQFKIEQDKDALTIVVDGKPLEPISTSNKSYSQIFAEIFEMGVNVGMSEVISRIEQEIEDELKDCGVGNGR